MHGFFNIFIKFFVLLTPFFVLTVFLSITQDEAPARRRIMAVRVTVAVLITTLVLFYFGGVIFDVFGITLDAFRRVRDDLKLNLDTTPTGETRS